ncbi:hypothetical protein QCN29_26755 [Streptomyces sp. HNM0663]|uniref:Tail assembly chaperone n=1 Tax=Streptomyces chengmaiensis TaxID=3040919 RepID=A0ABT6HVG1_9ACTN|nr:hypothetical protein [Streptomyces chengmaiensis]MDH2392312.1 hypothetical protein [Streptomyces chengmaiensis]
MAFDARKIADTQNTEPFVFIGLDGDEYELPNVNTLTGEQARRFRQGDESVLEEIADPDTMDAIDEMPVGVQAELSRAWVEHGGQPGKAASRSPRRREPARRSQSTSSSAARRRRSTRSR